MTDSGSNSAIDFGSESGGVAHLSGGTVIACGSSSMAEGFDATSSQCSLLYNLGTSVQAGTTVALKDKNGAVLIQWEVPCSFSSAIISCPEMTIGETYTVVVNNSREVVTLQTTTATLGSVRGSMFGGMNRGAMQPQDGFSGQIFPGRDNISRIPEGEGQGTAGFPENRFEEQGKQHETVTLSEPDRQGGERDDSVPAETVNKYVLAAVSAAALIVGLIIAAKFKYI